MTQAAANMPAGDLDPGGLAFRAQTLTPNEAATLRQAKRIELMVVIGVPIVIAAGLILGKLSLGRVLPFAALAVLLLAVRAYFKGGGLRGVVIGPVGVVAALLAASLAAQLLQSRLLATGLLSLAALPMFLRFAGRPLAMYQEWIVTDPRLAPDAARSYTPQRTRPTVWVIVAILATILLVPWRHSVTLAIAVLVFVALGATLLFIAKDSRPSVPRIVELFKRATFAQHLYLAYPDGGGAGLWAPRERLASRRLSYFAATVPLYIALVVGLSFCCPWELFATWNIPGFVWTVPPSTFAERSYDWLTFPLLAASKAHPGYLWCFVVSLPLLLFLPLALHFVAVLPRIIDIERERERLYSSDTIEMTEWDAYVNRLRLSRKEESSPRGETLRERDHLFLGTYPANQTPALLHRSILGEHMFVAGQSGSGKTALGLMPILIQLIRGNNEDPPVPILVLDLKGDAAMFNTAVEEAERRRPSKQAVRIFQLEKGYASHAFDPFASLGFADRSPIELAEILVQALNLFHGEYYGASYYSRQHRDLLLDTIAQARAKKRMPGSFADLYELIRDEQKDRNHADTTELVSVVHALAQYPQIGAAPAGKEAIDMTRVVAEGQVAYFHLPSKIMNMSAREIAKLALYSFVAAMERYNAAHPGAPRQGYVIVDEFQRIAAENVGVLMQQARSAGIGLVVATQDPRSLKIGGGLDLRPAVVTNCRTRQFFTVTDQQQIEELQLLSGEVKDRVQGGGTAVTHSSAGVAYSTMATWREYVRERLTPDEIRIINNGATDSLIHIVRDAGFTNLQGIPTHVQTPWPLGRATYDRRLRSGWPTEQRTPDASPILESPEKVEDQSREEFRQRNSARLAEYAKEMNKTYGSKPKSGSVTEPKPSADTLSPDDQEANRAKPQ